MPLDTLISGRIATLAGNAGFGWVEAIGIKDGRVAFAGSQVDLESRADPHTERIELEPDEVAIPALTDAHLHLADAALAARELDLSGAETLEAGVAAIAEANARLADPEAWLVGHGWSADRWGRRPTAADLTGVAPGRPVALWQHDHHVLWASREALAAAGLGPGTPDPAGGEIARDEGGRPTGILIEDAALLVAGVIPAPTADELVAAIPQLAGRLVALGVVAVHDPATLVPDRALERAFAAYGRLADRGSLSLRVYVSLCSDGLAGAIERGIRSGDVLGAAADGRARVGWLKLFADGTLGSRTAAMLEPFELEPGRSVDPAARQGIFRTEPAVLAELAARAAGAGLATQIHAIGDAAIRSALDALEPTAGASPLRPRVEHVQLVQPDDLPRFARSGIAASIQPVHLRSDAAAARRAWGERAERFGYPWRSLAESGALIPFGTDAPVEPVDPWPGIRMAVLRHDPSWLAGTLPFGPGEGLPLDRALRAACLDGPLTAGESDRGRLVPGQRADVVVLPSGIAGPAIPDGLGAAPGDVRPRLVLVDGEVAFEA